MNIHYETSRNQISSPGKILYTRSTSDLDMVSSMKDNQMKRLSDALSLKEREIDR